MDIEIKEITTETELRQVLDLCQRILGNGNPDLYGYDKWLARLQDGRQPLLYAECDGRPVSAVLSRYESDTSLIIGMVACDEEYRNRGITRKVMERAAEKAREMGFKTISLGSRADGFYEKCGYKKIKMIEKMGVYQLRL